MTDEGFLSILSSLLENLVRNFNQIKIVTIDSFTTRMALSHPLEIGLPLTWRIVEDVEQRRMLEQAIQTALDDEDHDSISTLLDWFFQGESSISLASELRTTTLGLLSIYRESIADAWYKLPHPKGLEPEELYEAIEAFKRLSPPRIKSGSPAKRFVDAQTKLARLASKEKWKEFLETTLVTRAMGPEPKTFDRREIPSDWVENIDHLFGHARASVLNTLAYRTESTYALLKRIVEALEEIQKEEGGYRFDDIVRLTADYLLEHQTDPSLIDTPIKHLLLDEFQDTSLNQWMVFRPIAEEIQKLSLEAERPEQAGSFFCVGDVKQAIYAWRGGVAEIFDEVESSFPLIECRPLNTNWRSTKTILDTVNLVFTKIGSCATFLPAPSDEVHDRRANQARIAALEWETRFQKHLVSPNNADKPGIATIESPTLQEDSAVEDDTDWETANRKNADSFDSMNDSDEKSAWLKPLPPTFQYAVHRAIQIHLGAPEKTIGILVRRNKYIGQIVDEITARGLEVSQEGGVPLTSSPAVRTIIALLLLADHPGHSVAGYALVANKAVAKFLGLDPELPPEEAALPGGPALSRAIRSAMTTEGIVPYLQRFAASIPLSNEREKQFLNAALKEAIRFVAAGGHRCDRLREIIESEKIELASASKIRVMTIHASKGLEFDTVILPELDQPLIDDLNDYLVERESPTEPILTVQRRLNQDLRYILDEDFRQCYDRIEQSLLRDSLNTLYVAMTRAVERLVMIVDDPDKAAEKQTFAGLLVNQLNAGHKGLEKSFPITATLQGEILYQNGELDSFIGA